MATNSPTQNSSTGSGGTISYTDPSTGKTITVNARAAAATQTLGVPTGYKAKLQQVPTPSPFAVAEQFAGNPTPAYTQPETQFGTTPYGGAQYTITDAINAGNADPQTIYKMQQQLVQANLLSPTSGWRPGVWDTTTQSAYAQILGFANKYQLNAQQALAVYIQNPKLGGSGAGSGSQPTISFTNPQDVATGFQNVSQNLTGQEQPTAAFQQSYHAQEAAQAHQRGTNYTQAPSVTGAATQYLINNDPSQVQAYGAASRMLELQNMLGVK